jgi:ATP-binding cassette subfamily B protein
VEFENVTFGYDKDRPVLNNVSFKVKPGEKVAGCFEESCR